MEHVAWENPLENFSWESLAWSHSFGSCRLISFVWYLALGNLAWVFHIGTVFGNFRLETFLWVLSLGKIRSRIFSWGNLSPEAEGTWLGGFQGNAPADDS